MRRRRRPTMARIREEMKTAEYDGSTNTLTFANDDVITNVAIAHLNVIACGVTSQTRIGKRVIMKALQIRGAIVPDTASTPQKVSLILVYVRSVNAVAGGTTTALPHVTEILTTRSPNALTNRDYASKFKILRRWDYYLSGVSGTSAATGNEGRVFEEYIVFKKPLLAQWQAGPNTTGIYSEMEKGALLLISLGNVATAATTNYKFNFQSRLYFTETDGYAY